MESSSGDLAPCARPTDANSLSLSRSLGDTSGGENIRRGLRLTGEDEGDGDRAVWNVSAVVGVCMCVCVCVCPCPCACARLCVCLGVSVFISCWTGICACSRTCTCTKRALAGGDGSGSFGGPVAGGACHVRFSGGGMRLHWCCWFGWCWFGWCCCGVAERELEPCAYAECDASGVCGGEPAIVLLRASPPPLIEGVTASDLGSEGILRIRPVPVVGVVALVLEVPAPAPPPEALALLVALEVTSRLSRLSCSTLICRLSWRDGEYPTVAGA